MKKVFVGLFILGTMAFGRFEKEFGFQEIEKDEKQIVLEADNCIVMRFGMNLSKKEFYDTIESTMKGKEYKIIKMSSTVVWVEAKQDMIFCNSDRSKEFIIIVPSDDKGFKKAYDYLEANDVLSADNGFYLSDIGLSMVLGK